MSHRVLYVDPDGDDRRGVIEALKTELDDLKIVFEEAESLSEAIASLSPDISALITEYTLPDGTGVELIDDAEGRAPDTSCILHTDTDPDCIDTDELRGSIAEYVGKGSVFGSERLAQLLRTSLESKPHLSYPLPQDETERLSALQSYDLDDPELIASLERITTLAADHFEADDTSINIIDEHSQEFLACYGTAEEWETMHREDSICTFTILEDDGVMAVEDVTEDPRFESRSERLIEFGIRSYIGANLVTPAGLVIGPLCVYDDEPRTYSESDTMFLKNLASVAMDLIELHARIERSGGGADA